MGRERGQKQQHRTRSEQRTFGLKCCLKFTMKKKSLSYEVVLRIMNSIIRSPPALMSNTECGKHEPNVISYKELSFQM